MQIKGPIISLQFVTYSLFHLQSWADAFRSSSSLSGVVHVYDDLRRRGLEFPMTDLDALSPIHTPNRVRLPISKKKQKKNTTNLMFGCLLYRTSDNSCRASQKMELLRCPRPRLLPLLLQLSQNHKLLPVLPVRRLHLHFSPVKDQPHFLQNRYRCPKTRHCI